MNIATIYLGSRICFLPLMIIFIQLFLFDFDIISFMVTKYVEYYSYFCQIAYYDKYICITYDLPKDFVVDI